MDNELCIQALPSLNMHEAGTARYRCFIAHLEPGPKRGLWGHGAQGPHYPLCSWVSQSCSKDTERGLLTLDKTCTKPDSSNHQ